MISCSLLLTFAGKKRKKKVTAKIIRKRQKKEQLFDTLVHFSSGSCVNENIRAAKVVPNYFHILVVDAAYGVPFERLKTITLAERCFLTR